MINLRSRYLGSLIGLATGDAVGTTLEFALPGTFEPINDMIGGGPFMLRPGEWTDDTSMALCLAESLLERRKFDAADQMRRYVRWRDQGHLSATGKCFDIGNTVSAALDRFLTWEEPYAGSSDPRTAGNGSLMRLAPIPMRWRTDPHTTAYYAALSSRTTHRAPEAVDACRYFSLLLAGALSGDTKEELLAEDYHRLTRALGDQPLAPEVERISGGSFKRRLTSKIRGSGYVIHTLEAALSAFATTDDFRSGLLKVVNLGEDADTTGAVYGQLAGAAYGGEAIPEEWQAKLAMADTIERYALMLLEHSQ